MPQCSCSLNNAPTKLMRGDYAAVCIYQFPYFMPDKNKDLMLYEMYNCLTTVMSPECISSILMALH